MFRPHLSYIAAISVNRRTSGYPWRGGPVRSDFQWRLLYPVNLRCLARSGRWRQRSSKWLGMLVIMLWTRCQVLISHLHNSWILNHSSLHSRAVTRIRDNMLYLLLLTRLGAFLAASICLSGPSVICSSWPDPEAELRSAAAQPGSRWRDMTASGRSPSLRKLHFLYSSVETIKWNYCNLKLFFSMLFIFNVSLKSATLHSLPNTCQQESTTIQSKAQTWLWLWSLALVSSLVYTTAIMLIHHWAVGITHLVQVA